MSRIHRIVRGSGWMAILFAALAVLCPGTTARADDDEDRVVAAYLEGVNLRIRAKADEARILEASGQKDRALAALREIGEIQKEAKAAVDRLIARHGVPPAPPVRIGRSDAPFAGRKVPEPIPEPPREDPDASGIRAVCAFLARAQGADGLIDREKARVEGDSPVEAGHDLTTTALAVLAWLDAATVLDVEENAAVPPGGVSPLEVAGRAVNALVKRQHDDGRVGDRADPAEHLLSAWALAAAQGRLARPEWELPFSKAVEWALGAQADDGWWGALSDDRDVRALNTIFALGLLHECSGMKVVGRPPAEFTEVVRAARERALVRATLVRQAPADRAAYIALVLMDRRAVEERLVPAVTPPPGVYDGPLDPLQFLFATLDAQAVGGTKADANLAEARMRWDARDTKGPAADSWSVQGARSAARGRAWTTAVNLLSFLYPRVPWRTPKGS